jgi:hypothetical protein
VDSPGISGQARRRSGYHPKRWSINIPLRDYSIKWIDLVPALAGIIGKISLVAAFASGWASALGILDTGLIAQNVRLELMVASIVSLLLCALLNPYAAPAGTLAPLIPLIPVMAAAGVHPLPFALLVSLFGFVFAKTGVFNMLVHLNGPGVKAGISLLFGGMGAIHALQQLVAWAQSAQSPLFAPLILCAGALLYVLLGRAKIKWLVIPACVVVVFAACAVFEMFPAVTARIGLPVMNPSDWWLHRWGVGFGLTIQNAIAAIPFVILVLAMWPIDALAIQALQERNYPANAQSAIMQIEDTFVLITIRNLVGAVLGGVQTAAVWRSFMIPLAVSKRPIGGSALLLGLLGILFAVLGFPVDIAIFPPLVYLVLIFGVFTPMLESGWEGVSNVRMLITAISCIAMGVVFSPTIGWGSALVVENCVFAGKRDTNQRETRRNRVWSIVIFFCLCLIQIGIGR